MENNFSKNAKQELEERAKSKLEQMTTQEKAQCVQKEKKRTYWWLGISLYCSLVWIIFPFTNAFGEETYNPIGGFIMCAIAGITISVCMIVKLFKNEDQIALIRILRETKKEIKEELAIKEKQERVVLERKKLQDLVGEGFVISQTIPIGVSELTTTKLLIDNEYKQFVYISGRYHTKKYKFSDIINYEVYENGNSKVQGRAGAALIGGAFFGFGGLIAGSSIRLNDFSSPQITIPYIRGEVDKSGIEYRKIIMNLQSVCSMLEYMLNEKTLEQSSAIKQEEKVVNEKSKKEQLQELKEMFDEGLISQEDFEQKKKQILGL